MPCEHCHPNISIPDDLYKINSATLCDPCKEEFYQARNERVHVRISGIPVRAVWYEVIFWVFFEADIIPDREVMISLIAVSINPRPWENCNVNEDRNVLRNYILENVQMEVLETLISRTYNEKYRAYFTQVYIRRGSSKNEEVASETVQFTTHSIKRISDTIIVGRLKHMRSSMQTQDALKSQIKQNGLCTNLELIDIIRDIALENDIGDDLSFACVAFMDIYDNYSKVRPIDLVISYGSSPHYFVVIGAGEFDNFYKPGMVVCDPYKDESYRVDSNKGKKHFGFRENQISKENKYVAFARVDESNKDLYRSSYEIQ